MISFLQFMRGYLEIKVWGYSAERFMNLCSNHGILLWNITKCEDAYFMCITLHDFFMLKEYTKKSRTRVAVLKRHGLPFFFPVFYRHVFFFAGFGATLFVWMYSSLYIWDIKIEGNSILKEEEYQKLLHENGVDIGVKRKRVDCSELERALQNAYDKVTWVSIQIKGTTLCVFLKENTQSEMQDNNRSDCPSDLISDCDGCVISIVVRSGVPKVKVGDAVTKGQCLISGLIPITQDDGTIISYENVVADGDVLIEHEAYYHTIITQNSPEQTYTGRVEKRYYVRIGKRRYGFPGSCSFAQYESDISEQTLELFKQINLPVYLGCIMRKEYVINQVRLSEKQAKEQLMKKNISNLSSLEEKGVQIIEKNVKIEKNESIWELHCNILVRELAASHVLSNNEKVGDKEVHE